MRGGDAQPVLAARGEIVSSAPGAAGGGGDRADQRDAQLHDRQAGLHVLLHEHGGCGRRAMLLGQLLAACPSEALARAIS